MFVVAGATGHVGSVVAGELLARGAKVKVIVRDEAKGGAWSKRGAEVAIGSLDDKVFLAGALKGAAGFFALLPPNYVEPDFRGHQRRTADAVAAAVKSSGVPHVVLLSSVGAELAEKNGPIKGLHHLENALRAAGTKLTAIRAGYFQENVASSIAPARQQGVFFNLSASADYPFPMTATRDVGRLAAQSLLSPPAKNEVVDLHGPAYSMRQLAEKLGAALGKKLQLVDIPPSGHVAAMRQAGLPQQLSEEYAEMYAAFAAGIIRPDGDRFVAGTTTIDEVLPGLLR